MVLPQDPPETDWGSDKDDTGWGDDPRTLLVEARIEVLMETNTRLNRRCQKAESNIINSRQYRWAYDQAKEDIEKQQDTHWQRIASKHGVHNKKFQRENTRLKLAIVNLVDAAMELAVTVEMCPTDIDSFTTQPMRIAIEAARREQLT